MRPPGKNGYQGRLVRWGEYAHYAEPWMRLLPASHLMFVKTEALEADPASVLRDIQAWAGLPHVDIPLVHSNFAACRGSVARGAWDEQRLEAARAGACKGVGRHSLQSHMSAAIAERLRVYFRPHNKCVD